MLRENEKARVDMCLPTTHNCVSGFSSIVSAALGPFALLLACSVLFQPGVLLAAPVAVRHPEA